MTLKTLLTAILEDDGYVRPEHLMGLEQLDPQRPLIVRFENFNFITAAEYASQILSVMLKHQDEHGHVLEWVGLAQSDAARRRNFAPFTGGLQFIIEDIEKRTPKG